MITFKYDKSGILLAYKDGKLIGSIVTMGDLIECKPFDELKKEDSANDKSVSN